MKLKQTIFFAIPLLIALNGCKKEDCAVAGDEDENGASDCGDEACAAEPQCQEDGTCALPFSVADPSNGTAGDTTGAPNQVDGSCLGGGAPDLVFAVTPTNNLLEVIATPSDAAFDIGVFVIPAASCVGDGSVAVNEIECSDAGFGGDAEDFTATVTPGQEVFIVVTGFGGDVGPFTLDVSSRNLVCGDGQIDGAEECDDQNNTAGDGCDAACIQEPNFNCVGEPSVCTAIVCGDGLIDFATEDCDDGDVQSGDGCAADCTVENGFSCDGEPSVCVLSCGDGFVDFNEECDDANVAGGDGCAADCTVENGFVCGGNPSVCASIAAVCASAVAVPAGGDTSLSNFDVLDAVGCTANGAEELFSFNAVTATVTITVTPVDPGGNYDPVVYAYLGNCADANELDCVDGGAGGDGETLVLDGTNGLPANGGALTIIVDSFVDGAEGAYTLTVVGN